MVARAPKAGAPGAKCGRVQEGTLGSRPCTCTRPRRVSLSPDRVQTPGQAPWPASQPANKAATLAAKSTPLLSWIAGASLVQSTRKGCRVRPSAGYCAPAWPLHRLLANLAPLHWLRRGQVIGSMTQPLPSHPTETRPKRSSSCLQIHIQCTVHYFRICINTHQ